MKRVSFVKKLAFSVLTITMFFAFANVVYASDDIDPYALFEEKQAVVDEINAEFGLELEITMASPEDAYGEPLTPEELRSLLVAFAVQQYELMQYFEAARATDYFFDYVPITPLNPQWRTLAGSSVVPWQIIGGPTVGLEMSARISHIPFTDNILFNTAFVSSPSGAVTHGPVQMLSAGVTNNGMTVRGLFRAPNISFRLGTVWLHVPDMRHQIDFAVFS